MEITNLENLIISGKNVFIAEIEDNFTNVVYKEGQQINLEGITNILCVAYNDKIELFEEDRLMEQFSTTHINLSNRNWCIVADSKEELNEMFRKFKESYIKDEKKSIINDKMSIEYSNSIIEKINKLSI